MEIDADQAAQDATVGGVAGVVFVTLIGTIVGFEFAAGPDPPKVGKQLHYLLATGALGTTAALAWRRSARVTVIGTVVAFVGTLALQPPTATAGGFAPDLTQLNVGLTLLVVVVAALATLEYGLRNPDEVRAVLTPGALRVGAIGGAFHVGIVLATGGLAGASCHLHCHERRNRDDDVDRRRRLLRRRECGRPLPPLFTQIASLRACRSLVAAVYGTLGYADEHSIVWTPLQLYGWLWVGVFVLVLGTAGVEYAVTRMEPPPGKKRATTVGASSSGTFSVMPSSTRTSTGRT
jgi:hypothetical protein